MLLDRVSKSCGEGMLVMEAASEPDSCVAVNLDLEFNGELSKGLGGTDITTS